MTVIKDAAEVAHALAVIDKRYSNIPGWEHLTEAGFLGRAAATAAQLVGIVHEHLRPAPITPRPPMGAAHSRANFEAAIVHRPEGRAGSIGI
jgi:hypothetical protein